MILTHLQVLGPMQVDQLVIYEVNISDFCFLSLENDKEGPSKNSYFNRRYSKTISPTSIKIMKRGFGL